MFPARAGMSPHRARAGSDSRRVPRTSGDEPQMSASRVNGDWCSRASGDEPQPAPMFSAMEPCSPHERG